MLMGRVVDKRCGDEVKGGREEYDWKLPEALDVRTT